MCKMNKNLGVDQFFIFRSTIYLIFYLPYIYINEFIVSEINEVDVYYYLIRISQFYIILEKCNFFFS